MSFKKILQNFYHRSKVLARLVVSRTNIGRKKGMQSEARYFVRLVCDSINDEAKQG